MPTHEDAPLRPVIVLGACEAPAARAPRSPGDQPRCRSGRVRRRRRERRPERQC